MTSGKAPIVTSDWLKEKLTRLIDMTEVVQKVNPELYSPDLDYGFLVVEERNSPDVLGLSFPTNR